MNAIKKMDPAKFFELMAHGVTLDKIKAVEDADARSQDAAKHGASSKDNIHI